MADVKISALPPLVSGALTDLYAVVQGGVTYGGTLSQALAALPDATGSTRGILTAADWLTFNGKQNAITLTTSGTSGPATLVGSTLNIPQYAGTTYTFSTGLTNAAGTVTANLSTGVSGGQTAVGGTAASNNLTLSSTSNATKGKILFGTSAYDELNNRLGIGTQSPNYPIEAITNTNTTSNIFVLQNQNNGSSANAGYFITNDLGTSGACLVQVLSSTFTPSGTALANSARIRTGTGLTNGISIGTGTTAPIVLYTNDTERARIFGGGNVAIGTTTDAGFRLDVNGTARFQGDTTVVGSSSLTGNALLVNNLTPRTLLAVSNVGRITVGEDLTTGITQTSSVIIANSSSTNLNLVLIPKGTGALIAGPAPDGTANGGNVRGSRAVDLQIVRQFSVQVASGIYSVIAGGISNQSSASYTTVGGGERCISSQQHATVSGGRQNQATGEASFVGSGDTNTAGSDYSSISGGIQGNAYLYAQRANAAGQFAALGDAQTSSITYRRSITGQAATELVLDGSSRRAILNISSPGPTNARVWNARIDLVAIVATPGAGGLATNEVFSGNYMCSIRRTSVAGSTALIGAGVITNQEVYDTAMSSSIVTIDADTTNEALRIRFTPPTTADANTVIRVVATAYLTEVGR